MTEEDKDKEIEQIEIDTNLWMYGIELSATPPEEDDD